MRRCSRRSWVRYYNARLRSASLFALAASVAICVALPAMLLPADGAPRTSSNAAKFLMRRATTTTRPTTTTTTRPTTTTTTRPTSTTTTRPTTTTTTPPTSFVLDASFDRPSKSDPENYRQKVDFNVVCRASHSAKDDPIVFPGKPGASHMHVFAGNTTINPSSTQASLEAGGTNCALPQDTASYWLPQLYDQAGKPLTPYLVRAYYRAGSLRPVAHIPRGLRIIAGDAMATAPQNHRIAGWQCRSVSPDNQTVKKQATIPQCPATDVLEGSVVFPNCWDGKNLDSPSHKQHMRYSFDDGDPDDCDAAHPIQLPQLTIAYRFKPGTTTSKAYLASMNSGLTLHADFWNAWKQSTLDALVDRCINAGVHCGDVSKSHFPGPIP
jgi:hypothetical protein